MYDLVGIKEDSSLTDALKRDGHGGLKILSANGEEYEDSIPNIGGEVKGNLQLSRPIERRKDLIALHNLSAEKLKGADELGGFAMPSVAITKDTIGHGEFGEVSLLLRPDSIDPRRNRRNTIFSGDAYTPTTPRISYHINEGEAESFLEARRLMAEIATRVEMGIGHELGKVAPDTRAVKWLNERDRGQGVLVLKAEPHGDKGRVSLYVLDSSRTP